jgi:hypothetical protein
VTGATARGPGELHEMHERDCHGASDRTRGQELAGSTKARMHRPHSSPTSGPDCHSGDQVTVVAAESVSGSDLGYG